MTAEISDSIARFREIGDATPVLMWTTDRENSCDWFNQLWLDFTGISLADAVSSGRFGSVHPEDQQPTQTAFDMAAAERDSIEVEYRLKSQSGEYRWMLDRAVPHFANGNDFVGYVGVCVDVTYQHEYRQRLAEREIVMQQLHSISEQERTFLSCAIHDGLLQDVIGAEMLVQGLAGLDADKFEQRIAQIRETLHSAIGHGRRLISELRPMILDEQGLASAVEFYAAELENRGDIKINVINDADSNLALSFWEGNVFRIIQEALNNVEAHSNSPTADVSMSTRDNRFFATIQDYGSGFDVQAAKLSFGVRCMYERAQIYGGTLNINSSDEGTTVVIEVPIPSRTQA